MSKEIIYNPEIRVRLMAGINQIARAAVVTYGSGGSTVMVQHRTDGMMPILPATGLRSPTRCRSRTGLPV